MFASSRHSQWNSAKVKTVSNLLAQKSDVERVSYERLGVDDIPTAPWENYDPLTP